MPLYIEKKLMVTSTDRPTDRVNIGQSAFFKSYKIEKRQRFAISVKIFERLALDVEGG